MGHPFEGVPRLTREEVRAGNALARGLGGLDRAAALSDVAAVLGAEVHARTMPLTVERAEAAADRAGVGVGLVLAGLEARAVFVLAPAIARVVADRAVGGTGADVALGPAPLSRGEAGLVGYVLGRALARAGAPMSLLDTAPARDVLRGWGPARIGCVAFELRVAEAIGHGALYVSLAALPAIAPAARAIDPTLPVRASLRVGRAILSGAACAALLPGDVLIPDELGLDPRIARTGRGELVIARSARRFELALADGTWRVARALGSPAPRAPTRPRRRKDVPMQPSDSDTRESLSDVEIELSIELARLEMPVAEVAALAPGVVVTTGRLVGERVAVRAGERVIAWGEVVDVEGEVGVRITEIPTR
ncbi:MAG: FliM/FliN family flagellar motor switch protein [Sandaracinus sp.]